MEEEKKYTRKQWEEIVEDEKRNKTIALKTRQSTADFLESKAKEQGVTLSKYIGNWLEDIRTLLEEQQ